jgi:hypothetical protein
MTQAEIVALRGLSAIATGLRQGEMKAMLTLAWRFLDDDDKAALTKAKLTAGWTPREAAA